MSVLFQTVAVLLFTAIPTLFWNGEPKGEPLPDDNGDRNVYLDQVENNHYQIDDGQHLGPYRVV